MPAFAGMTKGSLHQRVQIEDRERLIGVPAAEQVTVGSDREVAHPHHRALAHAVEARALLLLDLEPVPIASWLRNSLSIVREKAAERRIHLELAGHEDLGAGPCGGAGGADVVYELQFPPRSGNMVVTVEPLSSGGLQPVVYMNTLCDTPKYCVAAGTERATATLVSPTACHSRMPKPFDSICVHSDAPGAPAVAFDGTAAGTVMLSKARFTYTEVAQILAEPKGEAAQRRKALLPHFPGAAPYRQAWEAGVRVAGSPGGSRRR